MLASSSDSHTETAGGKAVLTVASSVLSHGLRESAGSQNSSCVDEAIICREVTEVKGPEGSGSPCPCQSHRRAELFFRSCYSTSVVQDIQSECICSGSACLEGANKLFCFSEGNGLKAVMLVTGGRNGVTTFLNYARSGICFQCSCMHWHDSAGSQTPVFNLALQHPSPFPSSAFFQAQGVPRQRTCGVPSRSRRVADSGCLLNPCVI